MATLLPSNGCVCDCVFVLATVFIDVVHMRCRPVEASPAAAAAAASAEDELIDSLGVCAAISTVSRYLPHCVNTNFNVRVCVVVVVVVAGYLPMLICAPTGPD